MTNQDVELGRTMNQDEGKPSRFFDLVQTCYGCRGPVAMDEGDVIYGSNWYHADCWKHRETEHDRTPIILG